MLKRSSVEFYLGLRITSTRADEVELTTYTFADCFLPPKRSGILSAGDCDEMCFILVARSFVLYFWMMMVSTRRAS